MGPVQVKKCTERYERDTANRAEKKKVLQKAGIIRCVYYCIQGLKSNGED